MSNNIFTPTLSKVVSHDANSSTIIIEPLHTGYGMTLGNSIRRVLLSSIAGAAVTSFRIEGAAHEFTTVNGVKEDVVEIAQNLKGLVFRVYSKEPQTVRISKKSIGSVTGADIKTNADVEVVNPEHVIANIGEKGSSLEIDITIEVGRGYKTIEASGHSKPSDFIALDAIFSPVTRVRYKVDNTRVGQNTDLDKLEITISTDGSISPREAFEEANAILVNQYTALAGQTRVESSVSPESLGSEDSSIPSEESILDTPIENLSFTARTANALVNNDIHTLKDLFSLSDYELRDLKGFGSKALEEVKQKMVELEL